LFEKLARPMMLPPEEVYPKFKEAQYGLDGRPYSSFFYTGKPNYYQTLYTLYQKYSELNDFQDQMYTKGVTFAPQEAKMNILDYDWLSCEEIGAMLLEKLRPAEYDSLIQSLDVLIDHPYSNRCKEFIMQYTKRKLAISSQTEIPPLTYTEEGVPFAKALGMFAFDLNVIEFDLSIYYSVSISIGKRKTVTANVTVYGKGSGKFVLNGTEDLQYFEQRVHRYVSRRLLNSQVFTLSNLFLLLLL
jgi:small subunit ribosomal protein S9